MWTIVQLDDVYWAMLWYGEILWTASSLDAAVARLTNWYRGY